MIEKIQTANLECALVRNPESSRVAYLIYPQVPGFVGQWLERTAAWADVSIVVVNVPLEDWEKMLTPWKAPAVPKGSLPFEGKAPEFLTTLQKEILPECEEALDLPNVEKRDLIGVSLGGLFTLWQWMQCDIFDSIGCLSGSFWYEGFLKWFDAHAVPLKSGRAYFLLGTQEPLAKVKAFQSVGTNTEAIVTRLKSCGIDTEFQWVPGDHFANPVVRAEHAFAWLYDQHSVSDLISGIVEE